METDEPQIRQRAAGSKVKYWANKLAVAETEPGLSTGQLMVCPLSSSSPCAVHELTRPDV